MKKVWIYAGTTEGRELAEKLAEAGIPCVVSVATEYGEQVMEETENLTVIRGRLTPEQMRLLYEEEDLLAVVDATHPFAVVVTENIRKSLEGLEIPYFRLGRDVEIPQNEKSDHCICFADAAGCAKALEQTNGRILLTTGSKELEVFCRDEELRKRLVVRVLPGQESLALCYENGLEGKQILAMQGPFSKEMNLATLKQYQISVMVTKESGKTGGVDEKLQAAKEAGVRTFLIQKPREESDGSALEYSAQQVYEQVLSLSGIPLQKKAAELRIVLAGIGMGDPGNRTVELDRYLAQADYVFGAARIINGVEGRKGTYPYYLAKDILPCLQELQKTESGEVKICILFSGDTGFYSGCEKLLRNLQELEGAKVTVLPGISSLAAFAAKAKVSWQDVYIISAHGVEKKQWLAKILYGARQGRKLFFLTSGPEDVREIGAALAKYDLAEDVRILIGFQMSYPQEKIMELSATECQEITENGLYVGMILPKEKYLGIPIVPGWQDELFLRDKVPMTKEEVRAVSLCKLRLTQDAVFYDIGSGTGSIAIEAAALSPDIQVYAAEANPSAVSLIRANCDRFGIYNLTLLEGMAPEVLRDCPAPTHAFIGGSKGNLKEILDLLYQKNPHMRVVMNAVSLENLCRMQELMREYPLEEYDIAAISVSKAKEVGEYHLMQANNPVTVFSFTFTEQE